MTNKIILTLGVAAAAAAFTACGAPAANTTNTAANKPANTNTASNTAANTAANTASNTAAAPATDGQLIKIEEAGIQVTAPKGWNFKKEGEDTVITNADGEIDFRFSVPEDGDYEAAIKGAAAELDSYLKNVKIDNPGSETKVDGMDARGMSGTAKNEGVDVAWNLTVIKGPKKPVLVNVYATKDALQKHEKETMALMNSVKKM